MAPGYESEDDTSCTAGKIIHWVTVTELIEMGYECEVNCWPHDAVPELPVAEPKANKPYYRQGEKW